MKTLIAIATLTIGLIAINPAADAHSRNYRCGLWDVYGSTTTTIAHDTGHAYCDVQARTYRRAPNGGLYYTTSPWRLYEAVAIEYRGTAIPTRNNCARYRERSHHYPHWTVYVSPWTCR